MSRGVTIATALVVLVTYMSAARPAVAAKRGCARAGAVPRAETLPQAYRAVLCLLNRERGLRGLSPLRKSSQLARAAKGHSRDMVKRRYFAHRSLDGRTPRQRVVRTGYFRGSRAGAVEEALACGWAQLSTPKALVRLLMHSPSHQRIVLSRRLRDVGIGLVLGGPNPTISGGATLTLDLGRR